MSGEKITDIILKIIAKTADEGIDLARCFLSPYETLSGKYDKKQKLSDLVTLKVLRNTTNRLKKNGCLEQVNKKGKIVYKITEKGRKKIEKLLFDHKSWDREWRIVIFDIPENQKRLRNILRSKLKKCGYKQLQKSVWVSPFDVLDEIEDLVDDFDLHGNVWYFKAKSSKNDESIIKMFLNSVEQKKK
ncbi:MAG: CRISPR-associated endonuclease Cas2 [Patescibacteria group bacterium]|nr:CRISPR-associated endonuclease Cas2 [Patescibacteria group bacterium]